MLPVIQAENISKAYQIGEFSTGTLSQDITRWYLRMRGKEDPYLKIGETNDRSIKGDSNIVWSLKDIDFKIEQGDAVGIIGRNGAGKSTLLKILSRVTTPTVGSIKIKGRIASLLEVGTGFHPELSGRENIFLNGAILGMRKSEIKKKFDEIVDFSGVERYIDTPVKRYSSGMYVRLAFAVAAHLESEILIIDEVLAVGDAEFQKKCLGKIGDVSSGEGKTVLFVSHNMTAVKELCRSGLYLYQGRVRSNGAIADVLSDYLKEANTMSSYSAQDDPANGSGSFTSIVLYNDLGQKSNVYKSQSNPYIEISYTLKRDVLNFNVGMIVSDVFGTHIYSSADTDAQPDLLGKRTKGIYTLRVPLPLYNLNTGNYTIRFLMGVINTELFDSVELAFSIEGNNFINTGIRTGLLLSIIDWQY
jgi:lipopolysaccharide transport system ATP-binding protein